MRLIATVVIWFGLVLAQGAAAQTLEDLARQLPDGNFNDRAEVVAAIAATGDSRAEGLLEALSGGSCNDATPMAPSCASPARARARSPSTR